MHEHGDGHGADSAGDRGDRRGPLAGGGKLHIPHELFLTHQRNQRPLHRTHRPALPQHILRVVRRRLAHEVERTNYLSPSDADVMRDNERRLAEELVFLKRVRRILWR